MTSNKDRHRSIEEAVYKVFKIPEALQEFSQNDEKEQFPNDGSARSGNDALAGSSKSSGFRQKDGQGKNGSVSTVDSHHTSPPSSSDTAGLVKQARFLDSKSKKDAKDARQRRRDVGEENGDPEDDIWEDINEEPVRNDVQNSRKKQGGTRKQQLTGRKHAASTMQDNKSRTRAYSKTTLGKLYKANLASLKEKDYNGLDLEQWCDMEELLLAPDQAKPTFSSADLITQHAHLGQGSHDVSSISNLLNMSSRDKSYNLSDMGDLLPENENFGLGGSIPEMLEKADDETLRDIMHVYSSAFRRNPKLKVDYDAFYESDPDTLSCCSDPPTAEEEDRIERRAWTIQLPEVFEMLRVNVGHLTNYALVDRSSQNFLALSDGLSERRPEVLRLQRCLSQLMEVSSAETSKILQNSRQLFVPFDGKMYVLHAMDPHVVMGRTTEVGSYSGFIGRPALGLFLLCFYGSNAHMVVTLDIVNSLVDYINFCVLDCLPEYEDGFEKSIKKVLDDEEVDSEKKKTKRRSRHELPVYTSKNLF